MGQKNQDLKAAIVFILPSFIGFTVFTLFPTISSFLMGLIKWDLLSPPSFVFFDHFRHLFSDAYFIKSLLNTAYYTFIAIPIAIFLSLIIASIIDGSEKLQGKTALRTILFLPHITSSVAVAVIWAAFLKTDNGLLNTFLMSLGIIDKPLGWLSTSQLAMPSIIIVGIWKQIGYFMVIFLAALNGIPTSYYEAAAIDGANPIQVFFRIKLPLVSSATFFLFTTAIIGSFQIFDLTSVLTNGGPAFATTTIAMQIYLTAFKNFEMGYASSQSVILFFIVFLVTYIQDRLSKKWMFEA